MKKNLRQNLRLWVLVIWALLGTSFSSSQEFTLDDLVTFGRQSARQLRAHGAYARYGSQTPYYLTYIRDALLNGSLYFKIEQDVFTLHSSGGYYVAPTMDALMTSVYRGYIASEVRADLPQFYDPALSLSVQGVTVSDTTFLNFVNTKLQEIQVTLLSRGATLDTLSMTYNLYDMEFSVQSLGNNSSADFPLIQNAYEMIENFDCDYFSYLSYVKAAFVDGSLRFSTGSNLLNLHSSGGYYVAPDMLAVMRSLYDANVATNGALIPDPLTRLAPQPAPTADEIGFLTFFNSKLQQIPSDFPELVTNSIWDMIFSIPANTTTFAQIQSGYLRLESHYAPG